MTIMKRRIISLALLACASVQGTYAQTHDNSVKTFTPRVATTSPGALTTSNSIITTQYFDGLGRPWQTVQQGTSPGGGDLVTLQEYDGYGRDSRSWLPVVTVSGNGGASVTASAIPALSSATYGDSKAYTLPVYEASPLNRVLEQYGAGASWQDNGKAVKTEYLSNDTTQMLSCRWYRTTDSRGTVSLSLTADSLIYPHNRLYVVRQTDEEDHVSLQFTDMQGRTLLTRQMDGSKQHDTYYIYDSYGNLRAVLPPLAADALAEAGNWTEQDATLAAYAYLYKYDNRNRMEYKKLPGCGWTRLVYDRADRLVATMDAEQADKSPRECNFTLYDDMNPGDAGDKRLYGFRNFALFLPVADRSVA